MLDHTPSLSSLNSLASPELKILPEITYRGKDGGEEQEGEDGRPETEYESRTSSDEEDEDETPPQDTITGEKGKEKLSPSPGRRQRTKIDTLGLGVLQSPPRMRHFSSSSMSPIGNWLTEGHIKSLLLIILLIFYLHQIIKNPPETPSYRTYAASELRSFELSPSSSSPSSPTSSALSSCDGWGS